MSATKPRQALRTFASLRFRGDRLEPGRVTEILRVTPTLAYRKGEIYKQSGNREARGRTNLWLLSSKGQVDSSDLIDHLDYLLSFLYPSQSDERVKQLNNLMRDGHVEADVGCFWYGARGAQQPAIPERMRIALERLPARLELDFNTD